MAYQNTDPTFIGQLPATGVIAKYNLVKISGAGVAQVDGVTDRVIGVAQEGATAAEVTAGKPMKIQYNGASKVVATTATVAIGDVVYAAASGGVTDTGAANEAVGIALQASSAVGDIIAVQLFINIPAAA